MVMASSMKDSMAVSLLSVILYYCPIILWGLLIFGCVGNMAKSIISNLHLKGCLGQFPVGCV
jgi:hypothetical protein